MRIEPVTPLAPRGIRHVVLTQRWSELTFLHWPVSPAEVAPLLPEGTRPDVLDGVTYVGLVPFRMVDVGLLRLPRVPWLGTFPETNVRLYSVDGAGRRGVVFRSLEAARLLPVLTARATLRLPYRWARMRIERAGDRVRYTTCRHRLEGAPHAATVEVRVGAPVTEPGPLEHFLTARWGLHTSVAGRTLYLPNAHPQWSLHHAEVLHLDENLIAAAGLPNITGAPTSALYSPGVPVRFGPPVTVTPDT
ncbi:YqjF family protein [Embleya sp. MST-111070]|uniref:YqjF family protein n=1 Tax=Embleya sp. MST-111070 TaxID=3398231 RepID=UPI003F737BC1